MSTGNDGSGKPALMGVRRGTAASDWVMTTTPAKVLAPHWSPSENPKLKQSAEGLNSTYGVLLIIVSKRLAVNYGDLVYGL